MEDFSRLHPNLCLSPPLVVPHGSATSSSATRGPWRRSEPRHSALKVYFPNLDPTPETLETGTPINLGIEDPLHCLPGGGVCVETFHGK